MRSCRNCSHAYLRVEATKHYNYEACALGVQTMTTYLEGYCEQWRPMPQEKQAIIINARPQIKFGEPIEL